MHSIAIQGFDAKHQGSGQGAKNLCLGRQSSWEVLENLNSSP